jgi:lipopolysaccharide biosynthesis protein
MMRLARVIAGGTRRAARSAHSLSSFLVSLARRRPTCVVERWPGALDLVAAPRIAVFVHFDASGAVPEFTHHYLREIGRAGFALVFVSNAPRLAAADLERLTPLCAAILRRDNVGRDFGAFKDGIATVPDLGRLDALLLANDSVYGPFHDLGEAIGRMSMAEADVWGITDSWERSFHLQSFFLLFGRRALASAAFGRFWGNVRYVQAKSWAIDRYEIGLTRALMADGLRCRALCPYREAATGLMAVADRELAPETGPAELSPTRRMFLGRVADAVAFGVPLNSCHFLWDHLVLHMGCPFIKRELLRDNPASVPGVIRWREVVQAVSKYDTDLIARHLEQSVRKRAV